MVLLLIVASCSILGWLILTLLRQRPADWMETAVLSCSLGVAIVGWVAILLAELGQFSLLTVSVIWVVLAGSLVGLGWYRSQQWQLLPSKPSPAPWFPILPGWLEYLFLATWLLLACWLFFRPHEFLLGAADAGVYVNLGASIAETGSILITDPLLAELDPSLYPAFLRPLPADPVAPYYFLPAYFVLGQPPGQLTPQFYPGHPVWLAIANVLSGGNVATMLLLPGLWALLGALVLYLLGRQLGGWQTAVLILLGITINALQVWFARYPTAESLSQFLLLSGLWSIGQWLRDEHPQPVWGLTAALTLGQFFLVRIDAIIVLPLFALLLLWQLLSPKTPLSLLAWFWLPFTTALCHAFYHGLWQSQPYFWSVFGIIGRVFMRNWELLLLGSVLAAIIGWQLWHRFGASLPQQWQQWLRGAAIAAIGIWAAYGWFVRPYINSTVLWDDPYSAAKIPLLNHENWLRLGWYLTAVGIWLGIIGICWLLWRYQRSTIIFVAVGLFFAIVYLTNSRANPHQIYVMRRYVPIVLPLFVLGAAYGLFELARWKRPFSLIAATLLALIWLGGLGWAAQGFISQVDYAGLTTQLDSLNAQLAPNSILIFNDQASVGAADQIATPLKFLYGHDILILRNPEAITDAQLTDLVQGWRKNGRFIYWLGDPTWLNNQGLGYTVQTADISSQKLESSYETKPTQVVPFIIHLDIAQLD